MPAKEDGDASAQSDGSAFLLLVRGLSDRLPLDEESQDPGRSSDPEDTALSADNTPESNTQTLVSDYEAEDTGPRGKPWLSLSKNQMTYLAHSQKLHLSALPCVP